MYSCWVTLKHAENGFQHALKFCWNGFSVLKESTLGTNLEFKSTLKNIIKTLGFYARCELFQRAVKSLPVHEKYAEKHEKLYTYTYEVQLHLRGPATPMATATPTRYSSTYEVQLHLKGTATPTTYSYS
jgi:hypothetical protein